MTSATRPGALPAGAVPIRADRRQGRRRPLQVSDQAFRFLSLQLGLTHIELAVLLAAYNHLDPRKGAWRPIKRSVLVASTGDDEQLVRRAMRALVTHGYLERGPMEGPPGRQVPTYRPPKQSRPATPAA